MMIDLESNSDLERNPQSAERLAGGDMVIRNELSSFLPIWHGTNACRSTSSQLFIIPLPAFGSLTMNR